MSEEGVHLNASELDILLGKCGSAAELYYLLDSLHPDSYLDLILTSPKYEIAEMNLALTSFVSRIAFSELDHSHICAWVEALIQCDKDYPGSWPALELNIAASLLRRLLVSSPDFDVRDIAPAVGSLLSTESIPADQRAHLGYQFLWPLIVSECSRSRDYDTKMVLFFVQMPVRILLDECRDMRADYQSELAGIVGDEVGRSVAYIYECADRDARATLAEWNAMLLEFRVNYGRVPYSRSQSLRLQALAARGVEVVMHPFDILIARYDNLIGQMTRLSQVQGEVLTTQRLVWKNQVFNEWIDDWQRDRDSLAVTHAEIKEMLETAAQLNSSGGWRRRGRK